MEEQRKLALASAVLGGYVLGRTKKGRLALTVATVVAGRGLGFGPKELAAQGARRLADVPQVAEVQEQVRKQGIQAVRGALSAVTDRGIGSLADAISGRTASITRKSEDAGEEEGEEEEEPEEPEEEELENEDEDEDESEEDEPEGDDSEEEPEEDEEPEPARPRRKAAAKKAPAKKAPAKKTAAKKTAPAKRTAKKTPPSRTSRRR